MLKLYSKLAMTLGLGILCSGLSFASLPEKFECDGLLVEKMSTKQTLDQVTADEKKDCQEYAERYRNNWQVKLVGGKKVAQLVPEDRQKAFEFFWAQRQPDLKKMLAMQSNVFSVKKGKDVLAKLALVPMAETLKLSEWQPCQGMQLPQFHANDFLLGIVDAQVNNPSSVMCSFAKGYLTGDRTQHRLILMKEEPQTGVELDEFSEMQEEVYGSVIQQLKAVSIGKVVEPVTSEAAYVPCKGPVDQLTTQAEALEMVQLHPADHSPDINELFAITKE